MKEYKLKITELTEITATNIYSKNLAVDTRENYDEKTIHYKNARKNKIPFN